MKNNQNTSSNISCRDFYVDGMHCSACELLIEERLSKAEGVNKVKANLSKKIVTIEGTLDEINDIEKSLTALIKGDGYELHSEKQISKKGKAEDFIYAVPISLVLIIIFILIQKYVVNLVDTNNFSYPVIFLIGIVASLSSCMAVVGGLVLSLSATYSQISKKSAFKSQLAFHISRLVSFFVLGGLVGLLGSAVTLSTNLRFALDIFIILVMFILALNLLDIFPFISKLQPRMPKFIFKKAVNQDLQNIFAPLLLGIATFFLPCGFTQAMQLQALSSASFFSGALLMLFFALGTLPALALISFSSIKFANNKYSGVFFKSAGIIVLFFVVLYILGALATIGVIQPILNI